MQEKIKSIIFNSIILLAGILLMLLLFTPDVQSSRFLQVTGRMHPVILHFPIVLLIVSFIWELVAIPAKNTLIYNAGDWLLLTAAFSAVAAALMGALLMQEEGYDKAALALHKWSGAGVALCSVVWYAARKGVRKNKMALLTTGVCSTAAVIVAGHAGAGITHGEGFLFAISSNKEKAPAVPLEKAVVFTDLIKPILQEKCINCHNSKKAKGDLIMETEALLLKGGKNGTLWDSTAAGFGLLMQRIHLPIQEDEHMPPKGKPQLTEEETALIYQWIKSGASFTKKLTAYPEDDSMRLLAAGFLQPAVTDAYSFAAADEATIKKLNTDYRVVKPVATGSPALQVAFYGAGFFKPSLIKELSAISRQVVSLHLANMPVQDEDLAGMQQFENLHTLNLSFTKVTGKGLSYLSKLPHLKQLSLAGLQITAADAAVLKNYPALKAVFLWNTSLSENEVAALQKNLPNITIDRGFKSDTVTAVLSSPVIEGKEQIFTDSLQLKVKHYMKGVMLRYTTDGSVPDSIRSPLYTTHVTVKEPALLQVKAFLPGWKSSAVATKQFYKAGFIADSVQLLTQPAPQYKASGGKTIIDRQTGESEFRNGKWLGYNKSDLQALLFFNQSTQLSEVSFSTFIDIGSYIMPAYQLEVWGGQTEAGLKLLKKINPAQPTVSDQVPPYRAGFVCKFNPVPVKVVKIIAKPVAVLPAWHPGKGTPGWVFIDEIFMN